MFGGIKRKLKGVVVSKLLAYLIKLVAEGKFGAPVAAIYWWLAGKKTYIGLALAAVYSALLKLAEGGCAPCADYAGYVAWLSAFLVSVGVIDAALRTPAPKQP